MGLFSEKGLSDFLQFPSIHTPVALFVLEWHAYEEGKKANIFLYHVTSPPSPLGSGCMEIIVLNASTTSSKDDQTYRSEY